MEKFIVSARKCRPAILFLFIIVVTVSVQAQSQLPNPGFENWTGSGSDYRPVGWSSFPQSDGAWAWAASTAQHERRNGGRPGTAGSYYLAIWARSILGVTAQGNMTTGRIHAGSTSASSSSNYNYSDIDGGYCQAFTGHPDSMYFWVSFYAANASHNASVNAYIHGNNEFQNPAQASNTTLYNSRFNSTFPRTTSSSGSCSWVQKRVAVTRDGSSTANYILISVTTNETPGQGSSSDELCIDDIEFIYSGWATGITIDGVPLSDFQRDLFSYTHNYTVPTALDSVTIVCTRQSPYATVSVLSDQTNAYNTQRVVTFRIVPEDGSAAHTHDYTVTLTAPAAVGITTVEGNDVLLFSTTGSLTVRGAALQPLSIYDIMGRRVAFRPHAADEERIILPAGLYLVQVGDQTAQRVIVR